MVKKSEPIEPTAPPLQLYPELPVEQQHEQQEDGKTFRLKQISEIRSFLDSENEKRSRLRRRYKSIYNTFFHISAVSGIIAVGAGAAGIGAPITVPITLPLGIAMGSVSVGTSALCKLLLKKVEKHERIKNIAQAKLSSINRLVSNALKDNNVSDEEFQLILNEKENYREHKDQIRRRVRTEATEINDEIKEQIRAEAGKKKAF